VAEVESAPEDLEAEGGGEAPREPESLNGGAGGPESRFGAPGSDVDDGR
jgi:hypothetical protein